MLCHGPSRRTGTQGGAEVPPPAKDRQRGESVSAAMTTALSSKVCPRFLPPNVSLPPRHARKGQFRYYDSSARKRGECWGTTEERNSPWKTRLIGKENRLKRGKVRSEGEREKRKKENLFSSLCFPLGRSFPFFFEFLSLVFPPHSRSQFQSRPPSILQKRKISQFSIERR